MRTISNDLLTEIESNEYFPFYLFTFTDDVDTYYYCDLDVGITLTSGPSGSYVPRQFTFSGVKYSSADIVDNISVVVDNKDDTFSSIFLDSTLQGESMEVYGGILSGAGDIVGTIKLFEGTIDSWQLDAGSITISVTSELSAWRQKTLSNHSPSCRWKAFKGTECQYAGAETWCDRTWVRCSALGNSQHFGGFRWLPELEGKVIWWGQQPDIGTE